MKISEKQIHELIGYMTNLSSSHGAHLSKSGLSNVCSLLDEIVNQQSTDIIEIKD